MAEARAAVTRPNVSLNAEGTGTTEAELELLKSTFKSLRKCALRTRYITILTLILNLFVEITETVAEVE